MNTFNPLRGGVDKPCFVECVLCMELCSFERNFNTCSNCSTFFQLDFDCARKITAKNEVLKKCTLCHVEWSLPKGKVIVEVVDPPDDNKDTCYACRKHCCLSLFAVVVILVLSQQLYESTHVK